MMARIRTLELLSAPFGKWNPKGSFFVGTFARFVRMSYILSVFFKEKIRTPYWKSRHLEKLSKLLKIGPKVSVPSFEWMSESQPSARVAAFNPLGLKAETYIWLFLPFDKQCLIFGYILILFCVVEFPSLSGVTALIFLWTHPPRIVLSLKWRAAGFANSQLFPSNSQ